MREKGISPESAAVPPGFAGTETVPGGVGVGQNAYAPVSVSHAKPMAGSPFHHPKWWGKDA